MQADERGAERRGGVADTIAHTGARCMLERKGGGAPTAMRRQARARWQGPRRAGCAIAAPRLQQQALVGHVLHLAGAAAHCRPSLRLRADSSPLLWRTLVVGAAGAGTQLLQPATAGCSHSPLATRHAPTPPRCRRQDLCLTNWLTGWPGADTHETTATTKTIGETRRRAANVRILSGRAQLCSLLPGAVCSDCLHLVRIRRQCCSSCCITGGSRRVVRKSPNVSVRLCARRARSPNWTKSPSG